MARNKDALTRLCPNKLVDLRVSKADELEDKDDMRRTRVLDITDSFVILEQPRRQIHPNRAGSSMGITYATRAHDGSLVREVLEVKLVKVGDFKLREGSTQALFFDYPFNVYFESVRRHFRVEVPLDEDVFVTIQDLDGKSIGSLGGYRVVDLSLQGLRFVCPNPVDAVKRLSTGDEVLTRVLIDKKEVLWAKSVIRAKFAPEDQRREAAYFGIEFLQRVSMYSAQKGIEFGEYSENDQRCLTPYITELQRKALRKERGITT